MAYQRESDALFTKNNIAKWLGIILPIIGSCILGYLTLSTKQTETSVRVTALERDEITTKADSQRVSDKLDSITSKVDHLIGVMDGKDDKK